MFRLVMTAAVSLMVGLGLGWLAFHADPVVQNVETRVEVPGAPAAAPSSVKVLERTVVAPPGPVAATPAPTSPAANAPVASAPPSDELTQLRARVTQLEGALENELKSKRANEGAPIAVPAGLDPRLRDEKQLVSTFNAALKEAGFPGQVTSVDCSEHPCIVFGNGFGDRGDMEKLQGTSAFGPYSKDSMSTFGFMRGQDNNPMNRFFGVAVMPTSNEPPDAETNKRIAFRVRQMEEVSRPSGK